MATAPLTPPRIAPETRDRVFSPLHKLRGTIRRYITWESLALAITLLGLWFWLGLAIDYGAFKIAGIDWVQILPHWVRWMALVLAAGLFALLMTLTLLRLLREFRPEALALVLERRFPKLLGDKLITAVELSDLDHAESLGYSRAMIIENVRDVSQRVEQVPVNSVFNWRRLHIRWLFALTLALGFLFLVAGVYLAWNRTLNLVDFGYRFTDVSSIWFERNILMQDTLWPRRSYLEIIEFPDTGELRIGRDAPSPRIKVRALKWVIADRSVADGWRALTWTDLNSDLLDGRSVPPLPTKLLVPPAEAASTPGAIDPSWTVDRVELLLNDPTVRNRVSTKISGADYEALTGIFSVLDKKAAQASMSRKLRKLVIPKDVKIYYWGAKTSDEAPMAPQQQGVNEFAAILSDLKESVKFYVKGEDFATYPYRRITLVPPPMLTKLEKDEYLPAYQYHRLPADGGVADLKGKKQQRLGQGVSLTGGTSRIEIASGSDLVLRGEVDKELAGANIRYRTAAAKPAPNSPAADAGRVEPLDLGPDNRSIRVEFTQITQPKEFDFEFTDTDNVKSLRHIIIVPIEDKSPDVNVAVEIIRRTPSGFMCTPQAMIPFSGNVRDDVGLSKVEYVITYARVESAQVIGLRAAISAGIMGTASPSPSPRELFGAAGLAQYLTRLGESRESATTLPPLPLKSFEELVADKEREHRYGKERLPQLLKNPPQNLDELRRQRHIAQFEVKQNLEFLDLQDRVPEFQRGQDETIRPRYRMRLTVQALDNNIETGPRSGQNKETFTFVVVPYEELLAEMNKDEENLAGKADEVCDKMADVRSAIDKIVERMPREAGSDEFRSSVSRMEELLGELEKGSDIVREMLSDASRLLKEAETNRVPANFIENKTLLVNLLDEAIRVHFEKAKDAHALFRDVLNSRRPPEPAIIEASRQRQDELINQLNRARDLVRKAIDITALAKGLGEVIKSQQIINGWIKTALEDHSDAGYALLGELSPKIEPIVLARGEKKSISIALGRDANTQGRFKLKFAPPPESELTLPTEKITPRVADTIQIEVTAGSKEGTFTVPVTVTPVVTNDVIRIKGDQPFVLKVTVK